MDRDDGHPFGGRDGDAAAASDQRSAAVDSAIRCIEPFLEKTVTALQAIGEVPDATPVRHLEDMVLGPWDTVLGRVHEAVGPSPFLVGLASRVSSFPFAQDNVDRASRQLQAVKDLLYEDFEAALVGQVRAHLRTAVGLLSAGLDAIEAAPSDEKASTRPSTGEAQGKVRTDAASTDPSSRSGAQGSAWTDQ